ncbi:MAG: polyamine aminopropyltransferase [Dethiobacteria bacterium]|jgi:spermidine synthase|nr:polyamine aminopropyltransferase [Bacillota bacterium]
MELWFTEKQTPYLGLSCAVKGVLYSCRTAFQELAILETSQFGRMLVLDGMVQTTIFDEYIYHEMIAHVPLVTHPRPRQVLVIGGGDGGTVREVVKHQRVEKVTLVEIDREVVEASRRFLPELSSALDSPKVELICTDGLQYVKNKHAVYDVIIVDSTEPVGAAVGLFKKEFYADVYTALRDDGILVAQTESPFYNQQLLKSAYHNINSLFPRVHLYLANIPTYPSGLWSFTIGSKKYDPLNPLPPEERLTVNRYYTLGVHRASFSLPPFISRLLEA